MLTVAALVAGDSGHQLRWHRVNIPHAKLLDTVIVSDYGSQFAGSVETFLEGSGHKANPKFFINGSNTNLGNFSGAAGDAVSSLTGNIAVTLPVVVFAPPVGTLGFGNGFVEIFAPGSNGNTAPISRARLGGHFRRTQQHRFRRQPGRGICESLRSLSMEVHPRRLHAG